MGILRSYLFCFVFCHTPEFVLLWKEVTFEKQHRWEVSVKKNKKNNLQIEVRPRWGTADEECYSGVQNDQCCASSDRLRECVWTRCQNHSLISRKKWPAICLWTTHSSPNSVRWNNSAGWQLNTEAAAGKSQVLIYKNCVCLCVFVLISFWGQTATYRITLRRLACHLGTSSHKVIYLILGLDVSFV